MEEKAGYFMVLTGALLLAISASVLGIGPGLFSEFGSAGDPSFEFMLKLALFFVLQITVLFAIGRLSGLAALATCDIIALMFIALGISPEFKVIFGAVSVPLLLIFAPLAYYSKIGKTFIGILRELGIGPEELAINVGYGIAGFVAVVMVANLITLAATAIGVNDYSKTSEMMGHMPLLFLVMAVTISPFAEEFFFRGLLFRQYGYLVSSLVFALAHWLYGSWVQMLIAFAIGIVFCALYGFRKSLIPPLVAHYLYNISFMLMLLFL
jgi:membrane protease YdiL (CAAX protease family)